MIRHHLAIASAVLTATCVLPYLRDIRHGTTRPQRMTWFVFASVSVVASVSQLLAGGGAGVWLSAGSAVGFSAVFVASIRGGVGGWARIDRVVLALAVLGLVASVAVNRPLVAVVAVVVAELVAVALTVRKAVTDPWSETVSTWMIDCAAGGVALAAVDHVSIVGLLYPIHHALANAAVAAAIARGRRRERHRPPRAGSVGAESDRGQVSASGSMF